MYILKATNIIDGTGAQPISKGIVVVKENKILFVGKEQDDTDNLDNTEIIDFGDRTLVPGMIDAHVHTSFNGEPDYWDIVLKQSESFRTLTSLRNVQADLIAGFTTLRVLGEKSHLDIALREAINKGIVTGPRVVCAGQNITVTAGHADLLLVSDIKYEQGLGGLVGVDGPEAVRKATRIQLKYGADLIKLLVTGGTMSEGSEPGLQHMSNEEIAAAVKEAKRVGKKVSAHAQGTEGIKNSVRAGVDTIEHGYFLDREGAQLMAKTGTYYVPTMAAGANMLKEGVREKLSEYVVHKALKAREARIKAFHMAMEEGVKIAVGTDSGSPFNKHGKNALELELMVSNGMSKLDAIKAAFQTTPQCLGIADKVGTLQSGMLADIVCLDKDPLQDIRNFNAVNFVMRDGEIVVKDGKSLLRV